MSLVTISKDPPLFNPKFQLDRVPTPYIDSEKTPTSKENDSFQVFVRARPLNSKELVSANSKKKLSIMKKQENMLFIFDPDLTTFDNEPRKEKAFVFDSIFDENDDNYSVYTKGLPSIIRNLISGFNSTVFAYGMTGAGKSYTMFGHISSLDNYEREPGISIYLLQDLFKIITSEELNSKDFFIKLSYLEIYNEHIRDLLTPNSENLMILEDPMKGVVVPDLTEYSINSVQDLIENVHKGNARRTMASTSMNQFSSRSHAIIQLTLDQKNKAKDTLEEIISSKLSLVDLAGSERAASSENKGIRMTEGAKINRSLLALGNCINILSDPNKGGSFVPYRDSKLTRLLKDSLGGNTKTIMIACITPSSLCYEETVNTLKYASRARYIKRKVVRNVKEVEAHVSQYKEIIESLKNEISFLRNQLKITKDSDYGNMNCVISNNEPIKNDILDSKYVNNNNYNENMQLETKNPNNYNEKFDILGKKIYSNLEENWEIKQSLNELKELKEQNEFSLKKFLNQLAISLDDPNNSFKKEKITEEILGINLIMENNEKVQKEMDSALEKNLTEKRSLQEAMRKLNLVIISENDHRNKDLENISITCKMLRLEKLDLYSQNLEMRNTIFQLTEEKKGKDLRIQELEDIVLKLKSDNPIKPSKRSENLENNQAKAPNQIYFKIPEKYLNNNQTKSSNNECNLHNLTNIDKKPDIKILKNSSKAKKTDEKDTKTTKLPVNIEELKIYAEKIKNLNFDNVKLKKRKKRHDKKQNQLDPPTDNSKHSPKSKNFIKEDEFLKITTLPTEDPDKLKIRGSFNEVSSILKEINQENSYENLEDFLKSLENNPENPFINKKNTHTERVFCRKDKEAESFNEKNMLELIEKRELSLEKNNKYSLQTLDVAREKARNFKNQLNRLLKSIGTCQINEQTKKEIQSLLQEFSLNKYIISQADKSILIKLQDLLLEEKPGSLQDKQRSYSANISNKNVLGFQNPLLPMNSGVNKIRSEIIEENMNDSEVEQDKEGFNLGNKITPGHFSKLNWNYAENVGKALENQSYGNPNNNKIRTKSREKLYSDIHSKQNSRNNSRSPMPLLENNTNKQTFFHNNNQKKEIPEKSRKNNKKQKDLDHYLPPKNPTSLIDFH